MFQKIVEFFKAILTKWQKDNVTQLAASLAFFAVLALAPLVIVVTAVVGFIYGDAAAQAELVNRAEDLVGPEAADVIGSIVENAAEPGAGGILATVFGLAVALFAASNIFVQLQNALNQIWDVASDPRAGLMRTVKDRLFAFALVLGIGLLLLASLVLSTVLSTLQATAADVLPGGGLVWRLVEFGASLLLFTLIFAVIFKIIPSAKVHWHDVWLGAAVTAVLFTIGRILMGIYLGSGAIASAYGAAASMMVLLIWIFYSTQILFFGAEFTQVYSKARGESIPPEDYAVTLPQAERYKRNEIKKQIAKVRGEEPKDLEETGLEEDESKDERAQKSRA
jgi:membrane protein